MERDKGNLGRDTIRWLYYLLMFHRMVSAGVNQWWLG